MFKIYVNVKCKKTAIIASSASEKATILNVLINDLEIDAYLIENHIENHKHWGRDRSKTEVYNSVTGEFENKYRIDISYALSKEERKLLQVYMSDYTCNDDIFAFSCGFDYISGVEDFDITKASYGGFALGLA